MEALINCVRIHATAEECADFFQCSADTIDRRLKEEGWSGFAEFYKSHQAEGVISLRRAQWQAAQAGNPTMLIWLGKQYLGQRDQVSHEHQVTGEVTFDWAKLDLETLEKISDACASQLPDEE